MTENLRILEKAAKSPSGEKIQLNSRESLHEKLQNMPELREDALDGAILTHYQVTCEWVGPDGSKYLSNHASENITNWQQMGYAMQTVAQCFADTTAEILFAHSERSEEDE